MTFWDQISHASPELFIAVAAMILLVVGVFFGDNRAREIGIGAVVTLIGALVLVALGAQDGRVVLFDGAFTLDGYSRFAKIVVLLGAMFALLLSDRFMHREGLARFEYPVLILLATLGMLLMVSATDLIALYMGIELQSLALYILAAFNRDSRRSTEAGLKYFVLGALSSGLLLYGASLIYGFSGATSFEAIAAVNDETNRVGLIFGLVFLISGMAFKVSAAPFHMWTPDVYEGSPTPVTAFFAAAPKFAAMVLFARVMIEAFPNVKGDWRQILVLISILSMAIGAFSALRQTNIKRLMAYSSIGHMGYALMGIAAGTQLGLTAVLIYMTVYVVMTIGIFACILSMRRPEGMAENLSDLSGLSQSQPGLAVMFTALVLSLGGMPPFIGFFPKFFIFMAAVDSGLALLAIFGALMSVVSIFYYLSIIRNIWFREPAPEFEREVGAGVRVSAVLATLAITIGTIVLIAPLRDAATTAASALF